MSRQLRKLQKGSNDLQIQDPSSDLDPPERTTQKQNAFNLLETTSDVESSDESKEEIVIEPIKKKKKNKSKGKKKLTAGSEDEIDVALKEIEAKYIPSQRRFGSNLFLNKPKETTLVKKRSTICVDSRLLDGDQELKKKFGSRVVQEETRGRKINKIKRSILVVPRENWPRFTKSGLSMSIVEKNDGI